MQPIDWIVFGFFTFITLAIGIFANYRNKKTNKSESYVDLILMGRKLTLPFFIMSLCATWYGGVIGVTDLSYHKGIYNFITQGFFWYITYIIFAFLLAKQVRQSKATTLPDLMAKELGPKSALAASWLNILNLLPISYIIAIGLLLSSLFDINLFLGSCLGLIFVILYSAKGGLRSVVYSDVLQFILMCSTVLIVLILSFNQFGGSEYLITSLPETHFEMTGGEDWSQLIIWGFIALSTLVDPNFYQRTLAAKDEKTAFYGILGATIVWVIFDLCTTLGGLYARAYFQDPTLQSSYVKYALEILPIGLKGLFITGLAASILSTLDSYLFLSAATIIHDVFRLTHHKKSQFFHAVAVITIGIVSLLLSVFFEGNIVLVWKVLGSLSAATLLIPFIVHRFIYRFSDNEFLSITLLSTVTIILYALCQKFFKIIDIDFFYVGLLASCFVASLIALKNFKQNLSS